eukprot:4849186-Pyramimonas_sp.AAC.1
MEEGKTVVYRKQLQATLDVCRQWAKSNKVWDKAFDDQCKTSHHFLKSVPESPAPFPHWLKQRYLAKSCEEADPAKEIFTFLSEAALVFAGRGTAERRNVVIGEMIKMKSMALVKGDDDPLPRALAFASSFPQTCPTEFLNESSLCKAGLVLVRSNSGQLPSPRMVAEAKDSHALECRRRRRGEEDEDSSGAL